MSFCTDDAVVQRGIEHEEVAFLHKPFTVNGLAEQIRTLLDAK
jgi:hypothetical protein